MVLLVSIGTHRKFFWQVKFFVTSKSFEWSLETYLDQQLNIQPNEMIFIWIGQFFSFIPNLLNRSWRNNSTKKKCLSLNNERWKTNKILNSQTPTDRNLLAVCVCVTFSLQKWKIKLFFKRFVFVVFFCETIIRFIFNVWTVCWLYILYRSARSGCLFIRVECGGCFAFYFNQSTLLIGFDFLINFRFMFVFSILNKNKSFF